MLSATAHAFVTRQQRSKRLTVYVRAYLQNASLSVLTQGHLMSMTSTDSLWGCDGEEEDTVPPLNDGDAPQPPETWLMLEFCDRGSLLVSLCVAHEHQASSSVTAVSAAAGSWSTCSSPV